MAEPDTAQRVAERRHRDILRALREPGAGLVAVAELTGDLGVTPKETIFARGTLKLFHYRPLSDELYRVPVLVVASLVNRAYILDLAPGQSLIEYLLRKGFDIYLIDWGIPRTEHQNLRLEDYVLDLIPQCVAKVQEDSGEPDVSMIGYCIGGLLSVMYAALHTDGPLKNLVCFAAPVNSDGLESLKTWMGGGHFTEDLLIRLYGNIPADIVQDTLRMLRPFGKHAGAMTLLNKADDQEFVTSNLRFSEWESDNIPFPGAAFKQMVNDFLRGNKLVRNEWVLGGRKVELSRIRVPFLHLVAESDHITPYASSKDLVQMVGSTDKREISLKGGHVGLVAGRSAISRMWPQLEKWLAERSV
jgi:poly[(R)-3-hydroxyalkanoate] polymerase subunit PhaC